MSSSVLLATGLALGGKPGFFSERSYSSSLYKPHSLRVIFFCWASAAEFGVVFFRSGEILQGRAEIVGGDDAQIDLQSAGGEDAGLGLTLAEHALRRGGV